MQRAARSTRAPPSTSTTRRGGWSTASILPGAAFSLASLFSGAAIGPEAPLVDINGGLGTLLAERMGLKPEQVKMMAYAGVAGALAAFLGGAPVGALLAMEFISPKAISMSRTDMVAGLASGATAWVTYIVLGGHSIAALFPFPDYTDRVAPRSRARGRPWRPRWRRSASCMAACSSRRA